MSDMSASVTRTEGGLKVAGVEQINYDFHYVDGVFDPAHSGLADCYVRWGRVLVVMDENMKSLYGSQLQTYFDRHKLPLTFHAMPVGEKAKTMESMLGICDAMTQFGIIRKEPVLVVGGGLVTDVAGFACACYRRNTNFIRVPTTLIGLIDASVSIKVAVNYGQYKNRLGAYHAPIHTFLDFGFLKTLPTCQVRNGFAELVKISSCADLKTFNLLTEYCEELIDTKFGSVSGSSDAVKAAAKQICEDSIFEMLRLETPNLHEIMLDRIIAFGHTWSPLHELRPDPPLRHGHAISIDMAFTVTLAMEQGSLSKAEHTRFFDLLSRAGLSMDHEMFDDETLEKATKAILRTRDGTLRLATPHPLGSCKFVNEFTPENLERVLKVHKQLASSYPRHGAGIEAYVDASDMGEGYQGKTAKINGEKPTADGIHPIINGNSNGVDGHANGESNGVLTNGHANGHANGLTNGHTNGVAVKAA